MTEPEERYAADLLRPLARPPRTPSTVDIGRAVAEGERRQRRARWAGSGGAALAVVLIATGGWAVAAPEHRRSTPDGATPPPSAAVSPSPRPDVPRPPTSCTPHRLPVPAGHPPKSVVTGADPTGRYILGRSYPGVSRVPRVLIWDKGKVRAVDMPGSDQHLRDITSTGVAVGTSFVDSDRTAAWVYRDGKVSRLAGGVAEANAINEREAVVGSVNGRPALWRSPTSRPTMLATPGPGWTGYAAGIDEDGTVVGRMQSAPNKPNLAYLWRPDGTLHQLAVPAVRGRPAATYTADAIRNGWVIGWAARDEVAARGGYRYIQTGRWNLRAGAVETSFAGVAEGVNRHGWMVGETEKGAVLVAGGRTVPLPDFGKASEIDITIPYTVSDDAKTVAGQVDVDGEPFAVAWRCR